MFSPTQDRLIDSQCHMTGITESPIENISPDESPPTDSGREKEFNSPPILNRLIDPEHSPSADQEGQNRTMGETSLFSQGEMYGAEAPIPGNLDPDGLFANPNGLGNSFMNHTFGWDADLETSYFQNPSSHPNPNINTPVDSKAPPNARADTTVSNNAPVVALMHKYNWLSPWIAALDPANLFLAGSNSKGSSNNPSGTNNRASPPQGPPDPSQSHPTPGSPGNGSDPSSIGNGQGPPQGSGGPGGGGGGGHGPPGHPNMLNDPLPSSKIFRMKPDLSFFPSLSDEGKFTQFYQGFEAAACGTGLGEVVDFFLSSTPWYKRGSIISQQGHVVVLHLVL